MTAPASHRATTRCTSIWGAPGVVARAPGRVNLIGEHTDYNDGFALPMALQFDTAVAIRSVGDSEVGLVKVDSTDFGRFEFDPTADPRAEAVPPWARHIAGVVSLLSESGVPSGGWVAAIDTDIPTGASLSSSAALQVALVTALLARADREWAAIEVALLGQRVENEIVGVPSGVMDQLVSATAVAGHATLMDCRDMTVSLCRVPDDAAIVVMDTGTRRVLADAEYAQRRSACERAARSIGVASLRDATIEGVEQIADGVDRRRARHVVREIERTLVAAEALEHDDLATFGSLMSESHRSLRDDFEVSGPALDTIVDIAQDAPGCHGARMTGGGFAGCAVALVDSELVHRFTRAVESTYAYDGHGARLWVCSPSAGASLDPTITS